MPKDDKEKERHYRILVYAAERVGIEPPEAEVTCRNYTLYFEKYESAVKFQDYDGVIFFQGIFCSVKVRGPVGYAKKPSISIDCDSDMLDRRTNELRILVQKLGFVCCLLHEPLKNKSLGEVITNTDLWMRLIDYENAFGDFPSRRPLNNPTINEFKTLIECYGAANNFFNLHKIKMAKPIAYKNGYVVSFVQDDFLFVISTTIERQATQEYFSTLADALTSYLNKRHFEVPEWADAFGFSEEPDIRGKMEAFDRRKEELSGRLDFLRGFKKVLYLGNDPLRTAVGDVLEKGFEIRVNSQDEAREDLQILDDEGNPTVFVEVKGVNGGVQDKHISQTKNHLHEAEMDDDFPAVLIANTHIKESRTIEEKDRAVGDRQIRMAVKYGVLVLRTLDLLSLLRLKLDGKISGDEILDLFRTRRGWLRVEGDSWRVVESGAELGEGEAGASGTGFPSGLR